MPLLTTTLLQWLDPQPKDEILDIGCGDGQLTSKIAAHCHHIFGLDASTSFIDTALSTVKPNHPNTDFIVVDCRRVSMHACETEDIGIMRALRDGWYDKVFSNAAMHWILRDEGNRMQFFGDVFDLLKPGGAFVFEMGGHGNVAEVHAALISVLRFKFGVDMETIQQYGDPWFFPSVDWMRATLEDAGFVVEKIEAQDRPTKMTPEREDGGGGLPGWVRLMGATFLSLLEEEEDREVAVKCVCEVLERVVTRLEDGSRWLGYVRLRAVARKQVPQPRRGSIREI